MGLEEATVAKRTRTGGRDARQRGRSGPQAPAYITRIIPPYEMMSEVGLVALENEADRILQEVGFEIRGDD
ncbi:MAG: trimethylamine methyltransferase, partial [Methylocystaceae bacterium]|nr:trimethylamine methyltransferase [Methylocystaceae bacterium]